MESDPPDRGQVNFGATLFFFLVADQGAVAIAIIILVALMISSALISGSEVAFFSLKSQDLKNLKESGSRSAKRILLLRSRPRRLLAAILISNNFINIAIVLVFDFIMRLYFYDDLYLSWAGGISASLGLQQSSVPSIARVLSFLITTAGVTSLLVLFGEISPKVYANTHNVRLAKWMSRALLVLEKMLHPAIEILVHWTSKLEKRVLKKASLNAGLSKEEIGHAIDLTVKKDAASDREVDILKGILKFGDVTVKQIMKSRVDVIAVDMKVDFGKLLELIRESSYSRLPVYEEDFDNVKGILYVKDLIPHLDSPEDFDWNQLIRENIMYVPEAKKINDLLKDFQSQRMHMAIVVDEYGGSSGVVTMEDVMEEVIGEIKDEFDDDDEIEFIKLDDHSYLFEGKTLINDVCRIVRIDTDTFDKIRGESDSIAGLILELSGHFPKKGQLFTFGKFEFQVISISKRRIEKIKLTHVR